MAEDYYQTLGLKRDASPADIQKAYRDLARKYHPDLNPNDKTAKENFQKVQAAFEVLNDPSKREMYDRYGSSFEAYAGGGGPRPQGRGRTQAAPGFEEIDLSDFFGDRFSGDPGGGFGDLFGQFRRASGGKRGGKSRAAAAPPTELDVHQEIEIPFQTAVTGGSVDLMLDRNGHVGTVSVKVPPGIDDGKKIRLRGQGAKTPDGQAGDLLLTVHVAAHPYYTRRGKNLEVRVPVTLGEAAGGGKVEVPTPWDTISLRVPPRTSSGAKLRVKGHGIRPNDGKNGDLFAVIEIVLPEKIDDATLETFKRLDSEYKQSPRATLRW
jgi:DnaJ-class molecular chaperone